MPDVFINDLDLAWEVWQALRTARAMELTVSLTNGGLLEQPEALFEDVMTIEAIYQRLKEK